MLLLPRAILAICYLHKQTFEKWKKPEENPTLFLLSSLPISMFANRSSKMFSSVIFCHLCLNPQYLPFFYVFPFAINSCSSAVKRLEYFLRCRTSSYCLLSPCRLLISASISVLLVLPKNIDNLVLRMFSLSRSSSIFPRTICIHQAVMLSELVFMVVV